MYVTLEEAANLLLSGKNVAVPTETVYGLAACCKDKRAIENIFRLKGRPRENPLIVHLSQSSDIYKFAELPVEFEALAKAFWPGPLTLVVPVDPDAVLSSVRAGLSTCAFRVPSHPLARELIKKTGPLVMPSANVSGRPSSTSALHVEEDFGSDFPVLDGGEAAEGVESTIVYFLDKTVVIREGAIPRESLSRVLGVVPEMMPRSNKPLCPGQSFRHYAPRAKLVIARGHHGAVVGFEDRDYGEGELYSLGRSDDAAGVARRLYEVLRALDRDGVSLASVDMEMPDTHLWSTIKERLGRAVSGV